MKSLKNWGRDSSVFICYELEITYWIAQLLIPEHTLIIADLQFVQTSRLQVDQIHSNLFHFRL